MRQRSWVFRRNLLLDADGEFMKAGKLREHTDEELEQLMNDTVRQVFDLSAKKGAGDSGEHPLRIRLVRRELARIKTVIRERERKRNG